MGLSSSSDVFNRFVEIVLQEINPSTYIRTFDDILLWGQDEEECLERLENLIRLL